MATTNNNDQDQTGSATDLGSTTVQMTASELEEARNYRWEGGTMLTQERLRRIRERYEQREQPARDEPPDAQSSTRPAWDDVDAFRAAVTPETIAQMEPALAGQALGRVFTMIENREMGPEDIDRVVALYGRADMSGLNAEAITEVYHRLLDAPGDKGKRALDRSQERALTANLANNSTAPAMALRAVAEEIVFGNGRQKDALALANNPNYRGDCQRILAASPDPKIRIAMASSPYTVKSLLSDLVQDPDDSVALASIRNCNSPHHPQVRRAQFVGISDIETLQTIRQQNRSWRDMPRCGVCGTWTGKDGVCKNKRCGGFGRVMTAARGRMEQPSLVGDNALPPAVLRKMSQRTRDSLERIQSLWQQAQQSGKFPPEWKEALPAAVSELSANQRWETPDGRLLIWDKVIRAYCLDGVPVLADSAGEAVRTYFAGLALNNEVAVLDDQLEPTGEIYQRWRYSPACDGLISHDSPEPDEFYLASGRELSDDDANPNPPVLPSGWRRDRLPSARGKTVFSHKDASGKLLIAHRPGSQNYAFLRESEDFRVSGRTLRQAISVVGSFASKDSSRPAFKQVWGFPADACQNSLDMDAPNGMWVASDGFRLMILAHEGESIPYYVNAGPELGEIIPDDAPVTMGHSLAWRDEEGHILEAEADDGRFPDVSRVIPVGEPELSFRITGEVPAQMVREAGAGGVARLEAEGGEVYATVLVNSDSNKRVVGRVKVGESDDKEFSGHLAAINPEYFNDVAKTKPADGDWTMETHGHSTAMVVKHSSRKALASVMPMVMPDAADIEQ